MLLFKPPRVVGTASTGNSEKSEMPSDPFSEFVAARPVTMSSQLPQPTPLPPQPVFSAPPQHFQPPPAPSFTASFNTPVISPQPAVFATSFFGVNNSTSLNTPTVDKYAALAELDRLGKMEENAKAVKPSFPAFTPLKPLHEDRFAPSSTHNPFQTQTFGINNPFVVMNDPTTFTMASNPAVAAKPTAPTATEFPSTVGQNSFNPFIVSLSFASLFANLHSFAFLMNPGSNAH